MPTAMSGPLVPGAKLFEPRWLGCRPVLVESLDLAPVQAPALEACPRYEHERDPGILGCLRREPVKDERLENVDIVQDFLGITWPAVR